MSSKINRVEIGFMGHDHFLYLPLFYAIEKKFFGHLPANCEVEVKPAPKFADQSAFDMLMDVDTAENRNVHFAVCDPALLLAFPKGAASHAVLLGGLVTNIAFWAVDTGRDNTQSFDDLGSFDRIIAFPTGSTSNGIARRAIRNSRGSPTIVEVRPGLELSTLKEVALESGSAVALTPDVIGLHELLAQGGPFSIELELAKTPEYAGVLVTALLTRSEILDQQRELCIALARGIQEAIVRTKLRDADVLRFCAQWQNRPMETVKRALDRAIDAHLFPLSIEVSQAEWMRTAECAAMASERSFSALKRTRAQDVFQRSIQPFAYEARRLFEATVHVGSQAAEPLTRPSARAEQLAGLCGFAACVLGLNALGLLQTYGWAVQSLGCCTVFAVLPGAISFSKHPSLLRVLRLTIVAFLAEQLLAYAGTIPEEVDKYLSGTIGFTLFIGSIYRHLTGR